MPHSPLIIIRTLPHRPTQSLLQNFFEITTQPSQRLSGLTYKESLPAKSGMLDISLWHNNVQYLATYLQKAECSNIFSGNVFLSLLAILIVSSKIYQLSMNFIYVSTVANINHQPVCKSCMLTFKFLSSMNQDSVTSSSHPPTGIDYAATYLCCKQ